MDGTGLLFGSLIESLPKGFNIEVVCLNDISGATYIDQAKEIANRFLESNIFIVAESYSGRIAYELCNILGSRVSGVVFIASFISSPSVLSRLASFLPISLLKPYSINKWLIDKVGFGGNGDSDLIGQVFESLSKADIVKLKQRLKNIAELNAPKVVHSTPATYIQPTRDYLVSAKAVHTIGTLFSNIAVVTLPGGHFIAQENPCGCSEVIQCAVAT